MLANKNENLNDLFYFKPVTKEIIPKEISNSKHGKVSTEAATQRCSQEKVFGKDAVNLQENTHTVV